MSRTAVVYLFLDDSRSISGCMRACVHACVPADGEEDSRAGGAEVLAVGRHRIPIMFVVFVAAAAVVPILSVYVDVYFALCLLHICYMDVMRSLHVCCKSVARMFHMCVRALMRLIVTRLRR